MSSRKYYFIVVFVIALLLVDAGALVSYRNLSREYSDFQARIADTLNLDEPALEGKSLPQDVVKDIMRWFARWDTARYCLLLIVREHDCSACLDEAVPLLKQQADSLGLRAFEFYASDTSSGNIYLMLRMLHLHPFKFPVFPRPGLADSLSLKRTPCFLLATKTGGIIYAHYPDYLMPSRTKAFFQKVANLLR
ncbi:MAG: hypothetical protein ACP5ON_11045 [Bacteroidota bacterium]